MGQACHGIGKNLAFRHVATIFSLKQKTRGVEADGFSQLPTESACFPDYYGPKYCNMPLMKVMQSTVFTSA
jgi:hypothetical protein